MCVWLGALNLSLPAHPDTLGVEGGVSFSGSPRSIWPGDWGGFGLEPDLPGAFHVEIGQCSLYSSPDLHTQSFCSFYYFFFFF